MHRFSRWKLPLSECQTVPAVFALVKEYLTTIKPEDIQHLPAVCQRALNDDDIAGSAVILIREELQFSGDAETTAILHEIAHTYVAASTRIAQIQARRQPVGTGNS